MRQFIDLVESLLRGTRLNEENRIPTRLPTAKKASDDLRDRSLTVDINSAKGDRKSFEHNVGLIKDYAALKAAHKRGTHEKVADHFVNHVKDNLLYLHDKMPEAHRERARKWYDGANRITAERANQYGLPVSTVAAVYAAVSPQKTWHENASIGDRILETYLKRQGVSWSPEMEETAVRIWNNERNIPIFNAIRGRKLSELADIDLKAAWIRTYDEAHTENSYPIVEPEGRLGRPYTNGDAYGSGAKNPDQLAKLRWGSLSEIGKAIGAIESEGDIDRISLLMGERHKVRNFYNNIVDPNGTHGDVTIDTHAVAAGLLHPLGGNTTEVAHNFKNSLPANLAQDFTPARGSATTGVHGTYPFYADAYRRAAAERNILPREMQSITWEAVKGLFNGNGNGKAKNLSQVKSLWNMYQTGKISADEVREKIHDISGGIEPPDWTKGKNDAANTEVQRGADRGGSGPVRNDPGQAAPDA